MARAHGRRVVEVVGALALGGVLMLSGCQSGSSSRAQSSAGLVNSKCPMVPGDPIDPSVTVDYKGQKVGFCCAGCIHEWDQLTDAQKDARLAKSR